MTSLVRILVVVLAWLLSASPVGAAAPSLAESRRESRDHLAIIPGFACSAPFEDLALEP